MSVIVPNSGCDNSVYQPWQPCRSEESGYNTGAPVVDGMVFGYVCESYIGDSIDSVNAPTVGVFV